MKPYFIEFITYRWFGHVDWREDVDVGVNRSKNDISHGNLETQLNNFKIH